MKYLAEMNLPRYALKYLAVKSHETTTACAFIYWAWDSHARTKKTVKFQVKIDQSVLENKELTQKVSSFCLPYRACVPPTSRLRNLYPYTRYVPR